MLYTPSEMSRLRRLRQSPPPFLRAKSPKWRPGFEADANMSTARGLARWRAQSAIASEGLELIFRRRAGTCAFVVARAAAHRWLARGRRESLGLAGALRRWSGFRAARALRAAGAQRGREIGAARALKRWRDRSRAPTLARRLARSRAAPRLAAALAATARSTAASFAAAARAARVRAFALRRALLRLALALLARSGARRIHERALDCAPPAARRCALRAWVQHYLSDRRARVPCQRSADAVRVVAFVLAARRRRALRRWRRAWLLARRRALALLIYQSSADARRRGAPSARSNGRPVAAAAAAASPRAALGSPLGACGSARAKADADAGACGRGARSRAQVGHAPSPAAPSTPPASRGPHAFATPSTPPWIRAAPAAGAAGAGASNGLLSSHSAASPGGSAWQQAPLGLAGSFTAANALRSEAQRPAPCTPPWLPLRWTSGAQAAHVYSIAGGSFS